MEKTPQDGDIVKAGQWAAQQIGPDDFDAVCRALLFDNFFRDGHYLRKVNRGRFDMRTCFRDRYSEPTTAAADIHERFDR